MMLEHESSSAKSLVFSQFGSTLKWLQKELPNHGFQYRTLSGDMSLPQRTKALRDFQKDPPTTIFLLSIRAGAVGINLTQANRVFLMEPCFNPALELQAIGRVHRLGQKRSVEIIRLVVQDSVESRMVQMIEKKHGKHSTDKGDDNDEDKEGRAITSTALVGSLKTDKASMVEEEFDLLFGVDSDTEIPNFHEDDGSQEVNNDDDSSDIYALL
jgi:SWI/SNF-related matrix-associated actin-dependent regulator of chromatin subfamily A3